MIKHLEVLLQKTLTSRKTMLLMFTLLFNCICLWFAKITSDQFVQFSEYLITAYIGAEGAADVVSRFKNAGVNP